MNRQFDNHLFLVYKHKRVRIGFLSFSLLTMDGVYHTLCKSGVRGVVGMRPTLPPWRNFATARASEAPKVAPAESAIRPPFPEYQQGNTTPSEIQPAVDSRQGKDIVQSRMIVSARGRASHRPERRWTGTPVS